MAIGEAARRSSAVAGAAPTTSVAAVTAATLAPARSRWNDMVLRFVRFGRWNGHDRRRGCAGRTQPMTQDEEEILRQLAVSITLAVG
ncbi:hypothetical protein GCM10009747_08510 [Agromyces humatus]|uniref:Uncharacterized protein n=1 Tax=Agromyces humatus TaxID=279573 RepID=A0ABP4WET0_9MICO